MQDPNPLGPIVISLLFNGFYQNKRCKIKVEVEQLEFDSNPWTLSLCDEISNYKG